MTSVSATGVGRRPGAGPCRRGRPLDDTRNIDIHAATLQLLAENGYDKLTMEAIAAKVHAGKATLYRRWPGKAELVIDALSCFDEDLCRLEPDTGSLRGDLRAVFLGALSDITDFQLGLMSGLLPALRRDDALGQLFEERFIARKLALMKKIFERAQQRGEVALGRDLEMLAIVGPALVLQRLLLTRKPVTRQFITRVVDEVILPLCGAPVARKPRKADA